MPVKYKLSVVFTVIAVGAFALPFVSSAQIATMTTAQMQAEIASLTAEVQALEQQLIAIQGGGSGGGTTATWCHVFNTNLSIGMTGSEVSALQEALERDGEWMTSKGVATGLFDDNTASAVTAFQEKYAAQVLTPNGLSNGTGYAGASTRAELNLLYGCGANGSEINVTSSTTPAPAVITSITPTWAAQGQLVTITINGSGFSQWQSSNTSNISPYSDRGFQMTQSKIISDNQAIATYQIASDATVGTRSITLGNSNAATFTVQNANAGSLSIASGLCTSVSQNYGNTFVDVNNGTILVNGQNYVVQGTPGVTAGANTTMDIYAYVPPQYTSGLIGTAIDGTSGSSYFGSQGPLVAKVVSGPSVGLNQGGVIQSITSYALGCPNYTVPVSSTTTAPTASLTINPSSVNAGQPITYSWNSTHAASWQWTLNIFKSTDMAHTVAADACGNSTGNWTGPVGGNSPSGSWTGTIAPCQAGYTYNFMYTAYTGQNHDVQAASAQETVVVNPATPPPTLGKLSVSENPAVVSGSAIAGSANVKIGSYILTNPSTETVNLYTMTIAAGQNAGSFQNLKLMLNGMQYGATQVTLSNNGTYAFSGGSPFSVPSNGSVVADVYADVLPTGQAGSTNTTSFSSCAGGGYASFINYTCNSVVGQTMTITTVSSAPSVSVSLDPSSPQGGQIVMGSAGNNLAAYRFAQTTNTEAVKLTGLKVTDIASTNNGEPFTNLTLYNGTTLLGTAAAAQPTPTGYAYQFYFANPVIILQGNSASLTLKGDTVTWASQIAKDNTTHQFEIVSPGDVTAVGVTSNQAANISISNANGASFTVLRSLLTMSAMPLGVSTNRVKSVADTFGLISFTANSAGPVNPTGLGVMLSGNALAGNPTAFLNSVQLVDPNGNVVPGAFVSNVAANPNTWYISWSFNGAMIISAGTTYSFQLRGNTTNIPPVPNVAESLSISIPNPTDVIYSDGADPAATAGLELPQSVFPVTINAITYPVGL